MQEGQYPFERGAPGAQPQSGRPEISTNDTTQQLAATSSSGFWTGSVRSNSQDPYQLHADIWRPHATISGDATHGANSFPQTMQLANAESVVSPFAWLHSDPLVSACPLITPPCSTGVNVFAPGSPALRFAASCFPSSEVGGRVGLLAHEASGPALSTPLPDSPFLHGRDFTDNRPFGTFAERTILQPLHEDADAVHDGWGSSGWVGDCAGVKKTSNDAAVSKLSSSMQGYFSDEMLKYFVSQPTRMQPLINRGYYSRVEAIRRVLTSFISDAEKLFATKNHKDCPGSRKSAAEPNHCVAQVVNVGAGADTTGFFLCRREGVVVFDIDFADVCSEKAEIIQRNRELRDCLGETCKKEVADSCVLRTKKYRLVGVDMRNSAELKAAVKTAGLREDVPTLFLCECVLIYLQVEEADAVIRWAAEAVPMAPCALILYEQFNPNDPFGRVMLRNLQIRNCPLLTIARYPTLDAQRMRFQENGWPICSVADMRWVYEHFLSKSERDRVQLLEIFDELEEWWLIQSHYFLGVVVRPVPPTQAGAAVMTLPCLINIFDNKL